MQIEIDKRLLDEVERQACINSLYEFVKSFWFVVSAEEFVDAKHIKYICDQVQYLFSFAMKRQPSPHDLAIHVPPGSSKTTIVSVMLNAWAWACDPTLRIITTSYNSSLSLENATKTRDIVRNPKYQRLFPHVIIRDDKSKKSLFQTTAGGQRIVTSTDGGITGFHAHIKIIDDPQDPRQAASETERIAAINHIKSVSTRNVHGEITLTILIMQRLHTFDVATFLKSVSKNLKTINLPAIQNEQVSPPECHLLYKNGLLDPVRISEANIEKQRLLLGDRDFSAQYMQNPIPEGGNIIKNQWFRYITFEQFKELNAVNPVNFIIDTSFGNNEKSDFSAIAAFVELDEYLYVLGAAKKRLKFHELMDFIKNFVAENGYTDSSRIFIEPKANGLSVIQQFRHNSSLNVLELKDIDDNGREKNFTDGKEVRLNSVSAKIEAGKVVLIRGAWNDEFVTEICGFPAMPNDEYVDLISYGVLKFLPRYGKLVIV